MPCDGKRTRWGQNIRTTNIYMTWSLAYKDRSVKPMLRLSKDKPRLSEMEHFGDLEERTSISIDENEIPISDSEDDYSFSSSVFEEFGIFKSNGLTRIEESKCYKIINGCVAHGGGSKDKKVAAVHKIPWSGPNGRLEAFRISPAEMVNKRGGNGNIKHAWLLSSPVDEYGLQHILLCSVILGKMEEVRSGSKQFKPSSSEFDSGVDNLSTPTRFITWEAYMNSRIFSSYVVSFRTLNSRASFIWISLTLMSFDKVSEGIELLYTSTEKKISRAQLIHRLRQLVGDELINDVIKLYTNKQPEGRSS
ncbi:probable inactive poly [ADP-ribose] polymerase SRO2 [Rhododendron vialii]|uniref:probable inactive poly [ADP-ribose] polymerase SRO2 n=1 Tax=Rhododendron vialii TaxID=182163 RepID=UPI00265F3C00|nr:probable inactive poly [ADP-ribose] polymerase SRO2 [Rhododendron vialii]